MNRSQITQYITSLRPTTKRGYLKLGAGIALVFVLVKLFTQDAEVAEVVTDTTPQVVVAAISSLGAQNNFATAGVVEAISEATLKAENGGQVVAVYTDLGKPVAAGAVIAALENSREQAALVQAQGSYDAAVAGAAQGNSGVRDAEIRLTNAEAALINTLTTNYSVANNILLSTIDDFFSNPTGKIPGLRVSGNSNFLNAERVTLQDKMASWQTDTVALNQASSMQVATEAKATVARMLAVVNELNVVVERDGDSDTLQNLPLSSYSEELLSARSSLSSIISTIDSNIREVETAKEALLRAEVGGTDSTVSLANAQIKIALGSLRAAQANYQKTLVRSPIAGVVNALYIKKGDYVSPLQDVALVANNGGLQVSTSINESDLGLITVGAVVTINDTATGTVSAVAGAVDPKTGKVAVKIGLDTDSGLTNGTPVTVRFATSDASSAVSSTTPLLVPLAAVKLTASGASLFTVSEEKTLVALPVELGAVFGDSVAVLSGADATTEIVLDARGRKTGETVTVTSN